MQVPKPEKKKWEKPESGSYAATIYDIVDLGMVLQPAFGNTPARTKPMIRVYWVLNVSDSTGRPFTVAKPYTLSMHEKSNLFKDSKRILGTLPPDPFETETMIGKSNLLSIVKEPSKKDPEDFYVYIDSIGALPTGMKGPVIPATLTRKGATTNGNTQTRAAAVDTSEEVAF